MTLEILLLVISILGIYEGARLSRTVLLFADSVGPGWYLFFMSALLFLCAAALLFRKLRKGKAGQAEARVLLHRGQAGRAILLLMFYGIAVRFLGYVIASALFFIFVQRIFGERSWVRCAGIGLSITACFYFIFSYLAGIPLP